MNKDALAEWLGSHWPSLSLTAIGALGMVAITVALFTGHSEQVTPILAALTTLLGLLAVLFKLHTATGDVKASIQESREEAVGTAQKAAQIAQEVKRTILEGDDARFRALASVAHATAQSSAKIDQVVQEVQALNKPGADGGTKNA